MTNHAETFHLQSKETAIDPALRTRCEVVETAGTRVMGYHRPVSSFNTGKQGEFNERTFFAEPSMR